MMLFVSITSFLKQAFSKSTLTKCLFSTLLVSASLIVQPVAAISANDNNEQHKKRSKKQLSEVMSAIAQQKTTIVKVSKKRAKLEQQLKTNDLAIAKVAKAINHTHVKLTETQRKISTLSKTKQQLSQQKTKQEQLLAKQLRAAYTTGNHDYLKLLLNQDKTDKIQRTISYYQYINDARIKEIDQFKQTLAELLLITQQHQQQISQLQTLENQQNKQKKALETNKKQRKNTLAKLNKELLTSKQQLAKLQAEESNLSQALQKLTALIQSEIRLSGLKKLKHKLAWPVKGKMLHRFGSQKQGYLKWKGVLISAPIGKQVQTIQNGTVLFSDWLKGYGLITVIDHGNGYMSLYGHNQTLLKSVGDRVETGEPIALIGQSGGQQRSGLYFEIRYNGKAVNPKLWCK